MARVKIVHLNDKDSIKEVAELDDTFKIKGVELAEEPVNPDYAVPKNYVDVETEKTKNYAIAMAITLG